MTAKMGCVIVTYNSEHDITNCLHGLVTAPQVDLEVVVVDNASNDGTVRIIQEWCSTHNMNITFVQASTNNGFAAGVNIGLCRLLELPDLDRFWILNPDCIVPAQTPQKLAVATLPFALLGHRICYNEPRSKIQIDGGEINRWTGATRNTHIGMCSSSTPAPNLKDIDFISGASMVASRAFIEQAGLMPEEYFLYYEEVDWAQRRTHLPLAYCPDAIVYHSAGASIGSPTLTRGASAMSAYFKHRARLKFMARFHPFRLPVAYMFGWGKALQHALRGQFAPIPDIIRAIHGMQPSAKITSILTTNDQFTTNCRIRSTS